MPKISQLPQDATPATTDYVPGVQASVPGTVRFLISALINLFWTLANIPAGNTSPVTRDNYTTLPFIANGLVWSGDAYASTLLASMTSGVVFLNGRFINIAAVSHQAMTASKDNYIDVLDNGDGTGTLVYTTVTNNAASPALAANSVRIAIIVAGASSIAAAGSVNQGQENAVLPIASSIAYAVTDSIGNLICPRDPSHRILGLRQIIGGFSSASTSQVQVTGLSCPVIVPIGRKIKISVLADYVQSTGGATNIYVGMWQGTVGSGTLLRTGVYSTAAANNVEGVSQAIETTPAATNETYNVGINVLANTAVIPATTTQIIVELC